MVPTRPRSEHPMLLFSPLNFRAGEQSPVMYRERA
jgi:hypothetical protein